MLNWLVLLLSLSTTSARLCTGPQFRPNMSLVAGESVELDCHLPDCPPPSRITWLRSDSPEEVRFPLVSDQPGIFTLHNAMPEESGWYICETDFYQSFVYLNILINTHPAPPPPPQPPVLRNFVTTRTPPTPAPVVVPVVSNVEYKVQTSPPSSQFKENSGTADQLQVYGTYQQAWHDKEALKTKLYDELEEMVARYLRPVNLQLEDIYQRLSTLEKRINQ